jgi:hydroxymethylpyrimidine pyrophosphatase-like HAD family hydrolase
MNEVAELQLAPTDAGTELSVIERAKSALASSNAEAVLTELAKKFVDVVTIKNRTDHQIVMGALSALRNHRVSIERTGKAARDDATKFSRAVIAEEKRLIGIIEPEETRLAAVRQAWEDEQERIRKTAEEAEEARKEALREKCLSFERLVSLATGRPSDEVQEVVDRLNATIITAAEFQEFARQAEGSLIAAKDHAARLLTETLERERKEEEARTAAAAEAERRRQEAAELTRQREENERANEELRKQQAAIRKEQQEAAAKLAQERAEIERQQQEAAAKLAQERAEIERQQQEAAAKLAQERAEIEKAQQEAAAKEEAEERLREEQARQVIEAAEAEKQAAAIHPAQPEPEPAAVTRPTLAEDLEGWRIRFKVNQKAHEALLAILASHQV